jgi:hypothetical protein
MNGREALVAMAEGKEVRRGTWIDKDERMTFREVDGRTVLQVFSFSASTWQDQTYPDLAEEGDVFELYEPKHTFAEACQWLLEGEKARRRCWGFVVFDAWGILVGEDSKPHRLCKVQVQATDWELYTPSGS